MVIIESMTHKAIIPLQTSNMWDVESRILEIQGIREWIERLVEWDTSQFTIHYRTNGKELIVWFEQEEHALMCTLRWG